MLPGDAEHPKQTPSRCLNALRQTDTGSLQWERAVEALADMGLPAVPVLVEALADEDLSVSRGAAQAVRRIGPSTIPHLIKALAHSNSVIRQAAAQALYAYGPQALEGLAELTDALKDRDQFVRQWAATALERMAWDLGPALRTAVPNLIQTLQDEDYLVREWSAHALGAIGEEAAEAIPFLEMAMVDDVPSIRQAAIDALNKISPPISDEPTDK